jgi:Protein of unknown function (DUF2917)
MPTRPNISEHHVDSSVFVRIDGRPGTELVCLAGCLWIARDGSPVDIELAAGERRVLTEPGRLVDCGFGPGVVRIVSLQRQPRWLAIRQVLGRWLAAPRAASVEPFVAVR